MVPLLSQNRTGYDTRFLCTGADFRTSSGDSGDAGLLRVSRGDTGLLRVITNLGASGDGFTLEDGGEGGESGFNSKFML